MKTFLGIVLASLLLAGNVLADVQSFDVSLTSPPGVYFGSGNANSNFTTVTNGTTELGLSVILRSIGPIDPGAGSNTYVVPTGTTAGKAKWNFDFSVNTRYNGGSKVLNDFRYLLNITDLTTSNIGPTFDPVALIADDSGFGPSGKTAGVTTTTEWGAQNSENLSFAGFLPGFDPNAPDLYRITLSETVGGTVVESVTAFANAGSNSSTTVPEPSSIFLLVTVIAGTAFTARKRARRT